MVIANSTGESAISAGSKCYVLDMPGDWMSVNVLCYSRGGRQITKWVSVKHLMNARVVNIPPKIANDVFGGGWYHGRSDQEAADTINGKYDLSGVK